MGLHRQGKSGVKTRSGTLALVLFATTAAGSLLPAHGAFAQKHARRIAYSVPAGPLAAALTAFGRQAGLQITYRPELVGGKRSPGVSGTVAQGDALERLLAGSGLAYRFSTPGTVSVFSVAAGAGVTATGGSTVLDAITVEGEGENAWGPIEGYVAHNSATASKTDTPLIETPQAVSIVGRDEMDAQGAQTVSEALRYSAGILTGTAGNQTRYDPVYVRGFGGFASEATYTDFIDGLKMVRDGRIATQVDPYLLERVEAFKGPASVLYGQASPGGFVNMVSKRPTEEPLREVELQLGLREKAQIGVDFGGPLNEDGSLSYRLTGLARYAESWIDVQTDERFAIAPSLKWQPDDATSLTLLASYQHDPSQFNFVPLEVLGTLLPGKPKVPLSFFDGDADWSEFNRRQLHLGYEFEHEFDSGIKLRQNLRYQRFKATTKELTIWGFNDLDDPSSTLLDRASIYFLHDWDGLSTDTQLQAEVDTGPIEHTLLAGIDYRHLWAKRKWSNYDTTVPPIDYLDPDYNQPIPEPVLAKGLDTSNWQVGLYAQDQMSWNDWHFTAGIRYDWSRDDTKNINLETGEKTRVVTDANAPSWRVGLVHEFANGFAPYVSYSTSFEPAYGEDWLGRAFKPTTGQQFEVGLRWQPAEIDASVTLSAFHLAKQNVTTADPNPSHICDGGPYCSVQTGEVRSRGLELEAKANLAYGWDIVGSATYWDVEITKDNDGYVGKKPNAVPEYIAALWLNHTVEDGAFEGLGLGGGVRYVGATWGDRQNTQRVPGFALFDAALNYDFGKRNPNLDGLNLSVNVRNLFDKEYIAACDYGWCQYGERRSAFATLKYKW